MLIGIFWEHPCVYCTCWSLLGAILAAIAHPGRDHLCASRKDPSFRSSSPGPCLRSLSYAKVGSAPLCDPGHMNRMLESMKIQCAHAPRILQQQSTSGSLCLVRTSCHTDFWRYAQPHIR